MPPAPTAVYIRVSSPKGQKTDSQRAELEAWLKRHKLKGVQWYEDRDSATNMQREAFQRLQADIFAGKVETVVVWKLDRLARNLKEGVNVLADWCKRGVRVVAITQQIDLNGTVGPRRVLAQPGYATGLSGPRPTVPLREHHARCTVDG
jgi:DNA invertase Pin-like site-specific DNA recombinase